MASAPITPPKFVPTLTEEVVLPADAPDLEALESDAEMPGGYELPAGADDADIDQASIPQHVRTPLEPPFNLAAIPELVTVVEDERADAPLLSDVVREAQAAPRSGTVPVTPSIDAVVLHASAPDSAEERVEELGAQEAQDVATSAVPASTPVLPDGYEEYVVHRVMQRVDVMLEQRLRDAIATVIQEQTRSIVPRLREEVESVVRQSVYEAVADELASSQGQDRI
ncbi:hypothetical protein SDC9_88225 [bioreactor metagenome]|uniref:DUF2486 family protein n=1 Tax=bioreactor metagenome TaxID=1076179 RepID=A0A644ZL04_9ZZZZ